MSRHARLNLLGMILLPTAAMIGLFIGALNGVMKPYAGTYISVAAMNGALMLVAGLISALLLRKASGDTACLVAVAPTLVPSVWGSLWYLWRGVVPATVAPGAEFIAAPQYLLIGILGMTFLSLIWRIAARFTAGTT